MAEQSSDGHITALDTLRGVAAAIVGVAHAFYVTGRPDTGVLGIASTIDAGYLAVDFFFVLSGFVLFLPVARRSGDVGGYGPFLFRRFTRLWPVYALALTVAYLVHPLLGVQPAALPPSGTGTWNLVAHVVLLPSILLGYGPTRLGLGVDGVVWSLSVEMCFSLVLPVIARWWFRHPVMGLIAALATSRVWVFATTTWGPGAPHYTDAGAAGYVAGARFVISLPTYALHFGVGMSLAYLVTVHGTALRSRLSGAPATVAFSLGVLSTVGLACLLGTHQSTQVATYDHWTDGGLLLPAFALLIVSASVVEGRASRVLNGAVGRQLAHASYPFYLFHLVVMGIVHHQWGLDGWSGFALCCGTLPVSFGLALLVHRLVEQPASEWGRRFARQTGQISINRLTEAARSSTLAR